MASRCASVSDSDAGAATAAPISAADAHDANACASKRFSGEIALVALPDSMDLWRQFQILCTQRAIAAPRMANHPDYGAFEKTAARGRRLRAPRRATIARRGMLRIPASFARP